MFPCIVIDFSLNNQPDALIIQIYSVIKIYMFRASSLPIIRRFLLYIRHCFSFMQIFGDRFQAECRMYGRKLQMMDREDARNMWIFMTE
jgi:hypothetical protein